MINFLVIGICVFLLLAVIFISAKPISMGIEARRNVKDSDKSKENNDENDNFSENDDHQSNNIKISDEIIKLNKLKNDGMITDEEYQKAKNKLLG
tara:strand:+ start:92 stop:376 length:285 start_codon:yes stop_codon:yes gene_type:complete